MMQNYGIPFLSTLNRVTLKDTLMVYQQGWTHTHTLQLSWLIPLIPPMNPFPVLQSLCLSKSQFASTISSFRTGGCIIQIKV